MPNDLAEQRGSRVLHAGHAQWTAEATLRGGPAGPVPGAQLVGKEAEELGRIFRHSRRQRQKEVARGIGRHERLHRPQAGLVVGLPGNDRANGLRIDR